jgi:hypothetical protein
VGRTTKFIGWQKKISCNNTSRFGFYATFMTLSNILTVFPWEFSLQKRNSTPTFKLVLSQSLSPSLPTPTRNTPNPEVRIKHLKHTLQVLELEQFIYTILPVCMHFILWNSDFSRVIELERHVSTMFSNNIFIVNVS